MHARRAACAVLLAIAALTAGCGSSDQQADKKPSSAPHVSKETRYLTAAGEITFNGTPSSDELLSYPPQWCDALASGHSVQWMFDMTGGGDLYPIGMEWGTAKADANELLVAGVRLYCPRNLSVVQDELRASGDY